MFLAAFFFWLTHLLCQASVGYFYFAHRSGRTGRYLDDFLSSMLVDAGVSFAAAVTFFAVPFLVWRAGWMRLRSRPVSLGATCGAGLFCQPVGDRVLLYGKGIPVRAIRSWSTSSRPSPPPSCPSAPEETRTRLARAREGE